MTAAIGVLKAAAIPPAQPIATRPLILFLESEKNLPRFDPIPAQIAVVVSFSSYRESRT